MKIIGRANGGFIVEISEREALQLIGSDRTYLDEPDSRKAGVYVGGTLKLDPLYEALTFEKNRAKRLEALETGLREAADIVASAAKALKEPRGALVDAKAG